MPNGVVYQRTVPPRTPEYKAAKSILDLADRISFNPAEFAYALIILAPHGIQTRLFEMVCRMLEIWADKLNGNVTNEERTIGEKSRRMLTQSK